MKLLKKFRKKREVIPMTPIKQCQDFVPLYNDKKLAETLEKAAKSLEEAIKDYTPEQIKKFEETFPGKHAKWRGNWTKGFTTWVAKGNDSKD